MRYAFDLQRGQAIGAMSVGMNVNSGFLGGRGMARSPRSQAGARLVLSATGRLQVGPWLVVRLSCARIAARGQKKIGKPKFLLIFLVLCSMRRYAQEHRLGRSYARAGLFCNHRPSSRLYQWVLRKAFLPQIPNRKLAHQICIRARNFASRI